MLEDFIPATAFSAAVWSGNVRSVAHATSAVKRVIEDEFTESVSEIILKNANSIAFPRASEGGPFRQRSNREDLHPFDPTLSWLHSVRYYDASRGDPTGHEKKSDLRRFADVVALAVRLYANPQPWGSAVRHHADSEVLLPT